MLTIHSNIKSLNEIKKTLADIDKQICKSKSDEQLDILKAQRMVAYYKMRNVLNYLSEYIQKEIEFHSEFMTENAIAIAMVEYNKL